MKKGKQSVIFQKDIFINDAASYVGKRESEGNLRDYFQNVLKDDLMKEKSYELAETKMQKMTVEKLFEVSGKTANDFDCIMGGDLQNQIFATSFCAREFNIPFFGLYGACSTFGEGLCAGGLFIESGNFKKIIVVTSSHFSSAERNYRFPLELGNQRTPLSQWTVTASGAVTLSDEKYKDFAPKITAITVGKVVDFGVTDANNMGAAMAPAAADTLKTHFSDLSRSPDYYDAIFTGDLGIFGHELCTHLLSNDGITMPKTFSDCGKIIFSEKQKVFMGGSGAGCSSAVFASYLFELLRKNEIKKLLLVPTGALLNKDSPLQKQSIPGIAHAVSIEV